MAEIVQHNQTMTVLHQDVAGVTADELVPSSDQHLGNSTNEQVSVGFSLPYSTKELDALGLRSSGERNCADIKFIS